MRNVIVQIQSVSDIITNSSSEVYLRTHYGCDYDLEEIIDALAGKGFSDNFEIKDLDDRISIEAKSEEYEAIAAVLRKVNSLVKNDGIFAFSTPFSVFSALFHP